MAQKPKPKINVKSTVPEIPKQGIEKLPKPGKGKGSVSPSQRDPKRVYTQKQKGEMLEAQGGKCAGCDQVKTVDEVHGHHLKRHADGGKTTMENGAALCKECHTKIHK